MIGKRRRARLLLLGALPPPIGGVATHVARLAQAAAKEGWDVIVADVNAAARCDRPFARVIPLRQLVSPFRLLKSMMKTDVTHIHLSGANQPYIEAFLILLASCFKGQLVLTLHGGGMVTRASRLSKHQRRALAFALSRVDNLIVVGPQMIGGLALIDPPLAHRAQIMNAYLPLQDPIVPPSDKDPITVVSSGGWSKTYGFDVLARALSSIPATDRRLRLRLFWYDVGGQTLQFEEDVRALLTQVGHEVEILPATIDSGAAYAGADIYVRATRTDGDSISVREALDAGLLVIASDAVPRPEGTLTFRSEDSTNLADLLQEAARTCRKTADRRSDARPSASRGPLDVYRLSMG